MKQFLKPAAVIFFIMIAMPYFAFATAAPIKSNVLDPLSPLFALKGPLVVCTGVPTSGTASGQSYSFSACQNVCDLIAQIANVIYFAIAVVIWIITPILVAVGGIMIMLGGANPGLIETGKKTITGAVWGIVIVLAAYLIVATFVGFLKIQGIGGFGTSSCQLASGSITTPTTTPTQ
jgi:hypothetical protein